METVSNVADIAVVLKAELRRPNFMATVEPIVSSVAENIGNSVESMLGVIDLASDISGKGT
jgi:hypothetical protein